MRDEPVRPSPTEFKLLAFLFRNAGRVLTVEQLLERVWGAECLDRAQKVHVHIHRLRHKLEADPADRKYQLNEPAAGYRFQRNVVPRGDAALQIASAGSPPS